MFASVAYAGDVFNVLGNVIIQPITTLVSVVITGGNIILNTIIGGVEVAIGSIPIVGQLPVFDTIGADGRCRLSQANSGSGVLEVYVGRCVTSASGSTIFISDFDCTFSYQPTFYIPQFFPGGILCSRDVFGDPLLGVFKHCDSRPSGMRVNKGVDQETGETIYDYTTGDAWSFCANEGQHCSFTGTKEVRFGENGVYFYGTYTGNDVNNDTLPTRQVAIYRFYIPADTAQATLNDWYINSVPNAVGNGFTDLNAFESIGYHTSIAPEAQTFDTKLYSEICSGNVCDKLKDNSVPPNSYVVYVAKMLGDYSWGGYYLPNKFLNTNNGPTADFPYYTLGNVILGPLRTGPCPKYKCSGASCVQDDVNGTYTTSNCNDACAPSPPSCPAGSVSFNPSSINVGQTSTASAPSGWSSGSFSSSNNSIAAVSGSTITGQSQGSADISGSGWTASNGATSCTLSGATLTVNSAPVTNNASCVGITAPDSVIAGQNFSATVTMSNTGTKPWTTDASPHNLGSQNPQDNLRWGLGRVALPSSPINSGQSATFNFTATAPTTPGTYPFDWKMVEDTVEWFGQTCSKTITVNPIPCHCSRCSTEKKYAWAEFNTTDTTCVNVLPAGTPVTFTCNCTCTTGSNTSWDSACQTMCSR